MPAVRKAVEEEQRRCWGMNGALFEFHQFALYMGTWILGWTMLFYSAGAGFFLALKGKKTSLQKITALCGTGLVVMMWLIAT
jgi:hypothetical protein